MKREEIVTYKGYFVERPYGDLELDVESLQEAFEQARRVFTDQRDFVIYERTFKVISEEKHVF